MTTTEASVQLCSIINTIASEGGSALYHALTTALNFAVGFTQNKAVAPSAPPTYDAEEKDVKNEKGEKEFKKTGKSSLLVEEETEDFVFLLTDGYESVCPTTNLATEAINTISTQLISYKRIPSQIQWKLYTVRFSQEVPHNPTESQSAGYIEHWFNVDLNGSVKGLNLGDATGMKPAFDDMHELISHDTMDVGFL